MELVSTHPFFFVSCLLCSRYSVDDYYSLINCVVSAANNLSLSCFTFGHASPPLPSLIRLTLSPVISEIDSNENKRRVNLTFSRRHGLGNRASTGFSSLHFIRANHTSPKQNPEIGAGKSAFCLVWWNPFFSFLLFFWSPWEKWKVWIRFIGHQSNLWDRLLILIVLLHYYPYLAQYLYSTLRMSLPIELCVVQLTSWEDDGLFLKWLSLDPKRIVCVSGAISRGNEFNELYSQ